jgi:hypothetical protein
MKLGRRHRWMLATLGGFVLVVLFLVLRPRGLEVVVYNNGGQTYRALSVTVNAESRTFGALAPEESAAFHFPAQQELKDILLYVEKDPPLPWTGTALASPRHRRVTLRIDPGDNVEISVERPWMAEIGRWLE